MISFVGRNVRVALRARADTCDALDWRAAGLVDSLGLVRLVIELERQHDIVFTDAEIESEEFCTIGGLTTIIERKLA